MSIVKSTGGHAGVVRFFTPIARAHNAPRETWPPRRAANVEGQRSAQVWWAPHKGVPYFGIGLIAGNSTPLPTISFTSAGTFATAAFA